MAKKDIVKVEAPGLPAMPSYMQGDAGAGTEEMQGYVTVPRLKIVQKQASSELLAQFGVGDVIITPVNVVAAEWRRDAKGRPLEDGAPHLLVVPVYFYPEWATWNPIALRGSVPAVAYRTTDPNDPVAHKSQNPGLRVEPFPDDPSLKLRHVEHLNFVLYIADGPVAGEVAVASFCRGAHVEGSKFSTLIRMRRAPIYGCAFDLTLAERTNQQGEWLVFRANNPEGASPWTDKELYPRVKDLHENFRALHDSSKLRAAIDDDEQATVTDEM